MRFVRVDDKLGSSVQELVYHPLSDLHCDAHDFAEKEFLARVKLIEKDPRARWSLGGDAFDLINYRDKRYDPAVIHPRYRGEINPQEAAYEWLVDVLTPIRDKCIGIGDGNHESAASLRDSSISFAARLATDLKCHKRYLGYSGFILWSIRFGTIGYRQLIDYHHGKTAGSTGNFFQRAEKDMGESSADILIRGHSHTPDGRTYPFWTPNSQGTTMVQRHRTAINSGSWRYGSEMKPGKIGRLSSVGTDPWHERKGIRTQLVGGPVLILQQSRPSVDGRRAPAQLTHTLIKGEINERTLGL